MASTRQIAAPPERKARRLSPEIRCAIDQQYRRLAMANSGPVDRSTFDTNDAQKNSQPLQRLTTNSLDSLSQSSGFKNVPRGTFLAWTASIQHLSATS
jgi:hypothetical protein